MNIGQAFASKWLKASDVEDSDLALTIESVTIESVGQGEQADQKPVVYFKETDKGLVLNKTNADAIARLHGAETDNWKGKMIALFATEVDFQGKQTMALRVRLKAPKTNGNGSAPQVGNTSSAVMSRSDWEAWCKTNNVDDGLIRQALGTNSVKEWCLAETGRSVAAAQALIMKVAAEPF